MSISSELENIENVIYNISLFAGEAGLNGNRLAKLHLSLLEALTNAITHGNKFDKNKKVKISWHSEGESVRIYVEDEGNGFNPDKVPNPLAPENIEKESGRGIHLIKQFSEEVVFNKKGNGISFLFSK